MKKYFAIVLCVAALLVLGAISVSAYDQLNGYWIVDSEKSAEVLAGEAGEKTTAWEVPFLHIKPTLDGSISRNEYQPFELYEDYLSWMAPVGDDNSGTTEEEFKEFYDSTQQDFFDAYWGWDGTYLYLAFDIRCLNGFTCTPDEMGGDIFLFAYNCLQVAISHVDNTGKGNGGFYSELGYGVHSKTGDGITFNWSGTYKPSAEDDFAGYYDTENQTLVYECRIHLQSVLGLTDRTVQNGDQVNFGWILAVNGEATTTNETWQLAFCHGIGGPYSAKYNEYLARITFDGMPAGTEIEIETIPGISEEDKAYGLVEFIDLSKQDVVNSFEAENAIMDYITEGEESFGRITAIDNDQLGFVYSTKYPQNLMAAWGPYIVVKYRTSYAEAEDLGLLYRNQNIPEYDLDNVHTEYIGGDGEWHTVIFDMNGQPDWIHIILNMGFVPFPYADTPAGQTMDIAWIKVYSNDPYDLYMDTEYVGGDDENEETTVADDSNDPADTTVNDTTTAVTEDGTTANTSATTSATTDATGDSEGGCASVVTLGFGALLLCLGGAVLTLRKREN